MRGWLCAIAVNVVRDVARAKKRRLPEAPEPTHIDIPTFIKKIASGKCVASVFAITSLAKEFCSSSVPKCKPAVRER